jgi:hypothetical protein
MHWNSGKSVQEIGTKIGTKKSERGNQARKFGVRERSVISKLASRFTKTGGIGRLRIHQQLLPRALVGCDALNRGLNLLAGFSLPNPNNLVTGFLPGINDSNHVTGSKFDIKAG